MFNRTNLSSYVLSENFVIFYFQSMVNQYRGWNKFSVSTYPNEKTIKNNKKILIKPKLLFGI